MLGPMLLTVFGSCLLAWFIVKLIQHLKVRRVINKIPGSNGLPILGHTLELKHDTREYFEQVIEKCRAHSNEGIMKFWVGLMPSIFVFKAHTTEGLLNSSKHMSKAFWYDFFRPWLGDGLLLSTGEKWNGRRKILTPSFHFKILEEFLHVMNEQAATLVSHLDKMADGPAFNVQPFMQHCALDIICEASMGVPVNAQENCNSEYVRAVYNECDIVLHQMRYPWLWIETLHNLTKNGRDSHRNIKILHAFTNQVITDRIEERRVRTTGTKEGDKNDDVTSRADDVAVAGGQTRLSRRRRLAFLDTLLEAAQDDPTITVDDIQEEVDTFMFAGHDTTATASTWIVLMLGNCLAEQRKVQQEIDSVLGDKADRDLTMDDMNELKYLECFIKETLRLYPPVPWYARHTSEDCIIGGYEVPKNTSVTVFTYLLHRDPEFFPDPEKFDPDRWLRDEMTSRHPYCYIPFSAGLRNCIGQKFAMFELKVAVSSILRRFDVHTTKSRDQFFPIGTAILKPYNVVPITLARR